MSDQELILPEQAVDDALTAQRVNARIGSSGGGEGGDGDAETPGVNPVGMVVRTLRGRMIPAMLLAGMLGSIGAVGGFMAKKPTYSSTGIVQVFPNKTSILYNDRDDSRLRLFDAFANAETSYLLSTPVLELAVEQPTLSQIGWPSGMTGVSKLSRTVTAERKGGLIFVSASDDKAEDAAAIVNGVLTAYLEMYHKQLQYQDRVRERELGNREQDLLAKLKDLDR